MKISLNQQIDEVDRELAQRAEVYPRLVATRKLRESIGNYQVERLKAVRATLAWLAENETEIKTLLRAKREQTEKADTDAT